MRHRLLEGMVCLFLIAITGCCHCCRLQRDAKVSQRAAEIDQWATTAATVTDKPTNLQPLPLTDSEIIQVSHRAEQEDVERRWRPVRKTGAFLGWFSVELICAILTAPFNWKTSECATHQSSAQTRQQVTLDTSKATAHSLFK